MRTDIGTADKSAVRRIFFALAEFPVALTAEEIAAVSRVPDSEVEEVVATLIDAGAVVQESGLYALSASLAGVRIWATTYGDEAFLRRETSGPPRLRVTYASRREIPNARIVRRYRTSWAALIWDLVSTAFIDLGLAIFGPRRRKQRGVSGMTLDVDTVVDFYRRQRRHRRQVRLLRYLPVPSPPPPQVIADPFHEDLDTVEAYFDRVLIRVGPPPGWEPDNDN